MAEIRIETGTGTQTQAVELSPDRPFQIAILGDFSGRANRGVSSPSKPVEIDPDNFEDVMERMQAGLILTAGEKPLTLRFRELDDFHPDQIYESLPLFQAFQEARGQAMSAKPSRPAAREEPPPLQSSGSLLDQIAGAAPARPAPAPSANDEGAWEAAIRKIVAKHVIPGPDPDQEAKIGQIDRAAGAEMRAILRSPAFQALEAAWRSVFLLFRQIDTGVDVKIYLIDSTREELAERSAALASHTAGDEPWSLIVGLHTFSPNASDCDLLSKIAKSARLAGAPFLSAMHPRLFGCESVADTPDPDDWKHPVSITDLGAWHRLRASADAEWLGLAMPRFLLRLPYGKKTSPIEAFDFEEMPEAPDHDGYLWGNPAIACACLLGQAFNRQGWDLRPGFVNRIDGMPIHSLSHGNVTPAAEIWMTERLAARMLADGIMPLASLKNSDAVQLIRFQSIADPARPLAGPW